LIERAHSGPAGQDKERPHKEQMRAQKGERSIKGTRIEQGKTPKLAQWAGPGEDTIDQTRAIDR
jgi:hypothetical protein